MNRRRNLFILLLVFGLLAASIAVIATKPTRLGLDLSGGVELVYQGQPTPQQPEVTNEAIERSIDIMRERVDKLGVAEPEIQRTGSDLISVALPNVTNAERAQEQVGRVAQLYFYDWEKNVLGPNLKPAVDLPPDEALQVSTTPIKSLYEAVKRASKRKPQNNPNNTTQGQYYLFNKKTKQPVGPDGKPVAPQDYQPAETKEELWSDTPDQKQPPGTEVLKVNRGTVVVGAELPDGADEDAAPPGYFVLNDDPGLTGTDIKDPQQEQDTSPGGTGQPIVTMDFTDEGRKKFQDITRELAQRGVERQIPGQPPQSAFQTFAIVLDNQIVSRPYIDFNQNPDGIDGSTGAQISGGFTIQSAQDLAQFLRIGALPLKLKLISESQVSATLGKQALDQGLIAGVAGLALVLLFLVVFYRVLGVIAALALLIYAAYFFALIKLIPITLTLPGIAGTILTLGVAADANIVIFERVKEEVRAGRAIPAAISAGYKKGLTAIIDANVVTIVVAFILFMLATAGVKGFALALGLGVIVSLFTAVLATQAVLLSVSRTKMVARPSFLGASKEGWKWPFDFMGNSKWFFSASGVIILACAVVIAANGINFGIDFESGTRIQVSLEKKASVDQVRTALSDVGLADAKIQELTGDENLPGASSFQISTETLQPGEVQRVNRDLDEEFGLADEPQVQSIGPTFGKTVAQSAVVAILASLAVISIYIALRFEWKFAVPILIAVVHDIVITAGVYAVTDREVTSATVAALLTILGYSLYDTIIVFDRIRENLPRMPKATFSQIANRSMSEVLTRSLATSFSTLLPILALLFFGGETLKDFAFALLVGTASGVYSSIFIATPVLTAWKEREPLYSRRRRAVKAEHGGLVPAFAAVGQVEDVDRPMKRKRSLRGPGASFTTDQPQEVSKDEFEEMVQDLGLEDEPTSSGPSSTGRRRRSSSARASGRTAAPSPPKAKDGDGAKAESKGESEPAASGEASGDDQPKGKKAKKRGASTSTRRKRPHGRAR
jgi:SecD/SecF fusion protein